MIAAIYARKSTDQTGVADDAKSVTRQIAQAAAFAESRGWTVDDSHVYVDDGVSGAEFAARPGFLRLMNALTPKGAPFQVLIMSEESRLGREAIETGYALKRLISAGVRVWFYLTNSERTLDSPTDKVLMSLTAFADEMERERARQRTYDALSRKAKAGHVTGGRTFGYRNVEVLGPTGARSHVERRIDDTEAPVIRQIFSLTLGGWGLTRVAKFLNEAGAISPRSQQGKPRGWSKASVLEILRRDIYRGVITWSKTRKRNQWGQRALQHRAEEEWTTVQAPELQIVDDATWLAVQAQRSERRTKWTGLSERGREARFLLTGYLKCGVCGSAVAANWRGGSHTTRWFGYACTAYRTKGRAICPNSAITPVGTLDRAVLGAILEGCLDEDGLEALVTEICQLVAPTMGAGYAKASAEQIATLDREIQRLTDAIASGTAPAAMVDAIRAREQERARLALPTITPGRMSQATIRARIATKAREIVTGWREDLQTNPARLRPILREILAGPIIVTPDPGEGAKRGITFEGEAHLMPALMGKCAVGVASPPGFEPGSWP